jgi:phosphoenolpyruvate carboxykinase (ATP)
VGDEADEGNWFYDFVMSHPEKVECYLLNTGGAGEIREKTEEGTAVKRPVNRVAIAETSANFRAITRHTAEWVPEPHFGTLVPKEVEGVEASRFDPRTYYSEAEIEQYVKQLNAERAQHLQAFKRLNPKVLKANV